MTHILMNRYMMLTVSTKYSRIPDDATKVKRYNATIDIWKEPVMISPAWSHIIRDAIRKKEKELGIHILNLAILPDHIHINIDISQTENSIPKIVKHIKWYSAYMYNRTIPHPNKQKWVSTPLRWAGYGITYFSSQNHLDRAINYVDSNHLKHEEKRWHDTLQWYIHESDTYTWSRTF